MRNLILTGGGTAGHCTPCLALIASLEKHFDNIYYIGSENGIEKELVKKAGGEVCGRMAILAEGDAIERTDITYLEPLPLFNADGTVK